MVNTFQNVVSQLQSSWSGVDACITVVDWSDYKRLRVTRIIHDIRIRMNFDAAAGFFRWALRWWEASTGHNGSAGSTQWRSGHGRMAGRPIR